MGLSFLKNLGSILNTGLSVATVLTSDLQPVLNSTPAGPLFTTIEDELPAIAGAIAQAEAIGQQLALAGPDKLKIAVPLVTQVVLKSPLMAGKAIADQAGFQKAIVDLTNGMVGILNSVQPGVRPVPAGTGADAIVK